LKNGIEKTEGIMQIRELIAILRTKNESWKVTAYEGDYENGLVIYESDEAEFSPETFEEIPFSSENDDPAL
jgi:hypothetical protein